MVFLDVMDFIRGVLQRMFGCSTRRHKVLESVEHDESEIMQLESPRDRLSTLPQELLVMVNNYLPPESTVALGLVSHDLHTRLASHVDWRLSANTQARLNLLYLLEIDLPSMLPCRACVKLYKWTDSFHQDSRCSGHHKSVESPRVMQCRFHFKTIKREHIDLIFRAHKRGPEWGLPASHLNHECFQWRGGYCQEFPVKREFEARMDIEGRLFVRGRYSTVVDFKKDVWSQLELMREMVCSWLCRNTQYGGRNALQASFIGSSRRFRIYQRSCPRCATDVRFKVGKMNSTILMAKVDVVMWRQLRQTTKRKDRLEVWLLEDPDVIMERRNAVGFSLESAFNRAPKMFGE